MRLKRKNYETYKEEKKKVKIIYIKLQDVNEKFRRKINQEVSRNRKLFWKEMGKVNGSKVE